MRLTKEHIEVFLDNHLQDMDFPSAYLGNEAGVIKKGWGKTYPRFCVLGGASYLGLAGNLAVGLITQLINEKTPALAHRAFFPNSRPEMEKFQKFGIPIFGIEEKRPLYDYDLLAASCSFPGTDFNIMKMLLLSGLDVWAKKRSGSDPIVLRGGATFSNVANFCDMYDLVFIGEGEESIPKFVEYFTEYRKGLNKDEFIVKVAKELKGFYAPKFTKEVYGEDKRIKGWELTNPDNKVPLVVKRSWVIDTSKSYTYTNQILNYVDVGFSAGNLLVSRGCHTRCTFCNEGFCNLPYRDLDVDVAYDNLIKAMRSSGAPQPLISAFCSSSYGPKKQLIKRLLEGEAHSVGFISQRVDECAEDENFVQLTALAGNKTVSLGIESASERGRLAINKHCTEAQILKAAENFMRAGYRKLKFFMISNLSMDEQRDVDDVIRWMPKVIELKKKLGSKAQLALSYTPLMITGHTPMEWYECKPHGRVLHNVIEWGMPNPDIDVRLGASKGIPVMTLQQLMFMCDRRLFPVWVELVKNRDYFYTSVFNDRDFTWLKQKLVDIGLPLEFWFRAKDKDEVFPWEFIDIGVSRKYLWKMKERSDNYGETPKCSEKCEACGVCDAEDQKEKTRRQAVVDLSVDMDKIVIADPLTVQKMRIKIYVKGRNRFIENKILRYIFRRACYAINLPINKWRITFASDSVKTKNWVEGVDYLEIGLIEEVKVAPEILIKSLQGHIEHFDILDLKFYAPNISGFTSAVDCAYYEMVIHEPVDVLRGSINKWMSHEEVEIPEDMDGAAKRVFLKANPCAVRVITEGFMGKASIILDARPLVMGAGVHPNTGRVWLEMEKNLSPLIVAQRMFGVSAKILKVLKVERLDYYSKPKADLFTTNCVVCDETIEQPIFGGQVSSDLCLSHLFEKS